MTLLSEISSPFNSMNGNCPFFERNFILWSTFCKDKKHRFNFSHCLVSAISKFQAYRGSHSFSVLEMFSPNLFRSKSSPSPFYQRQKRSVFFVITRICKFSHCEENLDNGWEKKKQWSERKLGQIKMAISLASCQQLSHANKGPRCCTSNYFSCCFKKWEEWEPLDECQRKQSFLCEEANGRCAKQARISAKADRRVLFCFCSI